MSGLVANLPTQSVPFPVNPERQMQLKVPGTFSQFALEWHGDLSHSLISKIDFLKRQTFSRKILSRLPCFC